MRRYARMIRAWITCHRRRLLRLLGLAVVAMEIVWLLIPDYRIDQHPAPGGTRIHDRHGGELRETLDTNDQRCVPVPLARTGDWAAAALVAAEDKRFHDHAGVDGLAILRAMGQNMLARRRVSGASTLSTLVVKLTQPRRRNLWTKVLEAHHAIDLEGALTKQQILEQFLNRAPFGGNLTGVETASRYYFGRHAADLSLGEATLLVGLPQAPSRYRPDRHYQRALRRREYVLERMRACGFITEKQQRQAERTRPTIHRHAPAFQAPHFCELILARYPRGGTLRTTLDPDLQRMAEQLLRARHAELADRGVTGAALVIVDVKQAALRAMVGSPDFWDQHHAGQVNSALARRPPGSTLKPFVYTRAMDNGMCTPATIIGDVPVSFSGYTPRNYGLSYCGPVTVRDALALSLNIPALLTAQALGVDTLHSDLRAAGLTTLDQPVAHYGISLAIGSCEATLLELTTAYACLARGGTHRPLRLLETEPLAEERRLYSPAACYLVADILGNPERSIQATGISADIPLPRLAWKTGTSTGHRDAWTIAFNPDYAVGVWYGNTDNTASDALVGVEAAAPTVFDVFRQIYRGRDAPWFEPPAAVTTRRVCARSGDDPTARCPHERNALCIRGVSAHKRCPVHQRGPNGTTVECWPTAIASFLAKQGVPPSTGATATDATRSAAQLRIASPIDGETVRRINVGSQASSRLTLALAEHTPTVPCYWFVDGVLYRRGSTSQRIPWNLQPGRHVITCSDANGNSDTIRVVVE